MSTITTEIEQYIVNATTDQTAHHAYCIVGQGGKAQHDVTLRIASTLCNTNETDIAHHPDVLHISPEHSKSQYTIDIAKQIREHVQRAPLTAPYSLVIIDDLERMNTSCANALLKSIEEPHEKVLFLTNTRSHEALIDTIRSRMQLFFLPVDTSGAASPEQEDFWNAFIRSTITEREHALQERFLKKGEEKERLHTLADELTALSYVLREHLHEAEQDSDTKTVRTTAQSLHRLATIHEMYTQNVNTKLLLDYLLHRL